jgi:tetratricopeptide (TPR) repeat protein
VALLRSLALVAALALPLRSAALERGEKLEDLQLPAVAGGKGHLVEPGKVNALLFLRPAHGHCLDALQDLAEREGQVPGVRWVAIVPGDDELPEAQRLIAGTGVRMPVLVDPGDVAYGRIGLKLHPTVVVVDRQGRLAATEPFREINYGDRVVARLRFTLGEIDEAQLARGIEPPRAETHSDAGLARTSLTFARKLLALGQLDLALAQVDRSLAGAPSAPGYALKGEILSRQGKCDDARRALDVALKLEPANAEAAAAKGRCTPGKARGP